MKRFFVSCLASCFLVLISCSELNAQSGTWVWMNGSSGTNSSAYYGTQGVAGLYNRPSAIYQAAQWTDKQGSFWIFGGSSYPSDALNDIWKYDPTINEWMWVKGPGIGNTAGIYGTLGIPSITNIPGARGWGSSTWTDSVGDLWLFGGGGYDSLGIYSTLNDLWRYHIATNEWTWMGGRGMGGQPGIYGNLYQSSMSFIPPPRSEANAAWTDANNNLWFLGGYYVNNAGYGNFGSYGDLWRYNIANNEWAWMAGNQQIDSPPNYGILGIESPTNSPGARNGYVHWVDSNFLYLAGGCNFESSWVLYNDVWRFNLNTNYWTWIAGDSGSLSSGQYTHFCSSDYGDIPKARFEQRSAQVSACSPVLFMWGGFASNQIDSALNDLWSFDLHTRKWRWISGYDSTNFTGNYGTWQVGSPTNMPRGASGTCFWSDNSGNLWLWGGLASGLSNAMWKYIPDYSCLPMRSGDTVTISSDKTIICSADSAQICAPSGFTSYHWNNGDTTVCINAQSAGNYYVTVSEIGNCSAVSNHVSLTVYTPPPVTISVNGDTLTGYNALTYQWLLNGIPITNATSSIYIAKTFGNYTLQVTDSNGCTTTSSPVAITGIANELTESSITVFPNPTSTGWQLSVTAELIGSTAEVFDATGRLVFKSEIRIPHSEILIPGLAKGVYELRITGQGYSAVRKLVKM